MWKHGKPYEQVTPSKSPLLMCLCNYYASGEDEIWGLTIPFDGVLKAFEQIHLPTLYVAKSFHETGLSSCVPRVVFVFISLVIVAIGRVHMDVDTIAFASSATIGRVLLELALSRLELKGLPSPLSNQRKCLTITMDFEKWCLYGVANVLSSSPNLENLVIKVTSRRNYYELDEEELQTLQNVEENFWEADERSFECLLKCLKTVEIVGLNPLHRMVCCMDL
ncbi:putative aldehyde dehydrogenase [Corchorus olitorius]|uniref:Aldehyde dehydrogenase n=1 Tax=Corchorus olitorius TaxID=93759 RepID=A0A1R3HAV8_9ROSI|nr:putative aldehyde dehydrogenase [Corchorus olitorius]